MFAAFVEWEDDDELSGESALTRLAVEDGFTSSVLATSLFDLFVPFVSEKRYLKVCGWLYIVSSLSFSSFLRSRSRAASSILGFKSCSGTAGTSSGIFFYLFCFLD